MRSDGSLAGTCLLDHLTAARLAMQILEQRTELSPYQRELLGLGLGATDRLADDLLEYDERRRRDNAGASDRMHTWRGTTLGHSAAVGRPDTEAS